MGIPARAGSSVSNRAGLLYRLRSATYAGHVARWTGTWLSGPGSLFGPDDGSQPRWQGEHLGLPKEGVGASASFGQRALGLLLDWLAAGLITSLFVQPPVVDLAAAGEEVVSAGYQYQVTVVLVWLLMSVPSVALFGFTPGMAAVGVRVGRLDGADSVGVWRALLRWVLTALLIPVLIRNLDGRSLHDRATGTVVVRMR